MSNVIECPTCGEQTYIVPYPDADEICDDNGANWWCDICETNWYQPFEPYDGELTHGDWPGEIPW